LPCGRENILGKKKCAKLRMGRWGRFFFCGSMFAL
jgi:hypothetical protein